MLCLDDGLILEQDREIVADGIDPLALLTLEAALVVFQREFAFADGTDQDFEQFFADRHAPLF